MSVNEIDPLYYEIQHLENGESMEHNNHVITKLCKGYYEVSTPVSMVLCEFSTVVRWAGGLDVSDDIIAEKDCHFTREEALSYDRA